MRIDVRNQTRLPLKISAGRNISALADVQDLVIITIEETDNYLEFMGTVVVLPGKLVTNITFPFEVK